MSGDERQTAAWDLYTALHGLAAGHTQGEMRTAGTPQGAVLGDVDYALDRLRASGPILARTDAELVAMAEEAVRAWADRSADRLVSLLPVIDQLATISSGHLPDTLPPV